MKNKRAHMQKRITVKIIALILTLFTFSSLFALGVSAETPKYENKEIEVSVELGSGSTDINPGCLTRVLLKVTNNTSEAIKGYAELHWGDSSYYIGQSDYLYTYIVDLDLNPGTTKEMLVVIDVVGSSRYFYSGQSLVVDIRNNKNKLLKQDLFTISYKTSSYIVGWLSDDAQSAEILKRTGNFGVELLTAQNFPSDFNVLKDYNFIIVNRADLSASSSYTQKQLDMLKKYVKEGGKLIIGTGADTKVLESFSDYFSGPVSNGYTSAKKNATAIENANTDYSLKEVYLYDIYYSSSVETTVDPQYTDPESDKEPIDEEKDYDEESESKVGWYTPSESDYSDITLSLGNITLTEITDGNFKLVNSSASDLRLYKHKDYELYIANFDFSLTALQKSSESEYLIIGLLNRCNFDYYSNTGNDRILINTYDFDTIADSDINFAILILILVVYVLAGIVTPFIIAKVKRKARYMLIGIPAAAILFSIFIFSASFIQKGGTTNENTIAFTKIENDGSATSYFTARTASPFSGSKTVSFGTDAYIYLCTARQYISGYDYSDTHTMNTGSEMTRKYDNVLNWVNTYDFGYQKMQYAGTLTATATSDPDTGLAILTVKNETGKKIRCAGVLFWNNIIAIGDMEPGAERTFTDISYNSLSGDCYDLLEEFFYKPNNIETESMKSDFGMVPYGTYGIYKSTSTQQYYYDDDEPTFSALKSVNKQSALEAFSIYQFLTNVSSNYYQSNAVVFGIEDEYKSTIKVNGSDVSKGADVNIVYSEQRVSATPIVNVEDADSNLDFHPKSLCSKEYNAKTDSYSVTVASGEYALYYAPLNFDKTGLLYGECEILSKTELADSKTGILYAAIIPNDGNTYELDTFKIEKGNTFTLNNYESYARYLYGGGTSAYFDGYEIELDSTEKCAYWLVVAIPNFDWDDGENEGYVINGVKAKLYLDPDINYVMTYPDGKFEDSIFVINKPEKTE